MYQPLPKYYMFNETGNIMLCTSERNISGFEQDIKHSFIDVTVFFAAMAKAIHTTINPLTNTPYSIYNYQATKNILLASNMFVEVNVEHQVFSSSLVGETMGKTFLQHALNRNFGGINLPFSSAIFNGMRYQHNRRHNAVKQQLSDGEMLYFRGGTIFFVCEVLMGIPQTTVILLGLHPESEAHENTLKDAKDKGLSETANIFEQGMRPASHKSKGCVRSWRYTKRSYLFIPPKFLKTNSASLLHGDSPEMGAFVERLRKSLPQKAES